MDLSHAPTPTRPPGLTPPLLEHLETWLGKPWVPWAINLTMLLVLAASLALWTWRLWQPPVEASPRTAAATSPEQPTDYDINALTAAHLFGEAAVTPGKTALEDIPLSSLNLILTGVLVNPTSSVALISADGAPELPFVIGDEITAGVVLHEVYADRALIRRGATTESLMLKETGPALPTGSVVTSTRANNARRNTGTVDVQRSGNQFSVEREQLNKQLQRPEFLSQALMVPNASGGFLVREIQPGSLYEKLGLKVGDVISSVNGQPVNTIEDVLRLYQQLGGDGGGNQVTLDVRRAGKNESLTYNLQ